VTKILTQRRVDTAKPEQQQYGLADGIVPGQRCIVYPTGAKSYRIWVRVNGKQIPVTVGDALLMTLAEARVKGKSILSAAVDGKDPREDKRAAARTAVDTVESVAEEFFERHVKPHTRSRSAHETMRLFEHDILPAWGKRPIASITLRDVNELLDAIVDRGSRIVANRVFAAGRKMFAWACSRGLLAASPFEHVTAPSKEISRDRVLDDSELALVLRAAGSLNYPFAPFVSLLAYLGQRRDEIAAMKWSELDQDLTQLALPRSRVKNELQHKVPLVAAVREILASLPRVPNSAFVFSTTGVTPISGFSKAKRMLDEEVARLNGGTPLEPWRFHDLRRSAASGMAALGVAPHVIEAVINHKSGVIKGMAAVYNRFAYMNERKEALEAWAQHLLALELEAGGVVGAASSIENTHYLSQTVS
jgi:integrase